MADRYVPDPAALGVAFDAIRRHDSVDDDGTCECGVSRVDQFDQYDRDVFTHHRLHHVLVALVESGQLVLHDPNRVFNPNTDDLHAYIEAVEAERDDYANRLRTTEAECVRLRAALERINRCVDNGLQRQGRSALFDIGEVARAALAAETAQPEETP